jgi:hypothetical protein
MNSLSMKKKQLTDIRSFNGALNLQKSIDKKQALLGHQMSSMESTKVAASPVVL